MSEGAAASSEGAAASSEGAAAPSEGAAAPSEGAAAMSEGATASSEGAAAGALAPVRHGVLLPAVLALALSAAMLLAQRRLDFTVNEEGFLWYGAVATAHGDVPLRDFYSYDPGRYYWAAAWTPLVGEGVLGLRLATAAFAALGLFCGLLAARRAIANPVVLAGAGIVLTLWLLPRNKLYEPAVEMMAVLAAVALIERPDRRRHLLAGAMVGFGAFMGKNHGVYLAVAFLALILLLYLRRGGEAEPPSPAPVLGLAGRLRAWIGGIALGASPLLVMLALVPGFLRSYVDSVLFFVQQGQTNFPRPVPWPWHYELSAMSPWDAAQIFSIGFCFLLTVVFFALGGVAVIAMPGLRLRRHALLAASVVVGAVYTHHAFSRADLAHLAPSIHPLLLGLLALPAACAAAARGPRARRALRMSAGAAVGLLLAAVTCATAIPAQPLYHQLTTHVMTPYTIAGEELWLRPRTLAVIAWVEDQVAARLPPHAPILLAPNLPGLYTILGRRSPVWNVYPIWPATGKLDERMLGELRRHHVAWAFIQNTSVDARKELLFRNSHPRVWDYLMRRFELAASCQPEHPWQCALLHEKPDAPPETDDLKGRTDPR
jgi:hypothetical protein